MRKVVQAVGISSADPDVQGTIVVVCDDGSSWLYSWDSGQWNELEPIPETERSTERAEEKLGLR